MAEPTEVNSQITDLVSPDGSPAGQAAPASEPEAGGADHDENRDLGSSQGLALGLEHGMP